MTCCARPSGPSWALIAVVSALAATAAAAQVEITLTNGEKVVGELVREDPVKVVIQRSIPGRGGALVAEVTYQRKQIASLVEKLSPEDEYKVRAAAVAADSGEAQLALALWCRQQGLAAPARTHALNAIARDPAAPATVALLGDLGLVLVDDAWVDEAEHLARRGLVKVGGKVMTRAEADALRSRGRNSVALRGAEDTVNTKATWVSTIEANVAKTDLRLVELAEQATQAKTALVDATVARDRLAGATEVLERTTRRVRDEAARSLNARASQGALDDQLSAQRAHGEARRAGATAEMDIARLNQLIAHVGREGRAIEAKKIDLLRTLDIARRELDEAKTKLEEVRRAAAPTPAVSAP